MTGPPPYAMTNAVPFTTYPAPAQSGLKTPDPADLWDYLVHKGLSEGDATRHVLRVLGNAPAEVQRQYLKDIDPGKLASFGLGAADMMSFGLGDQFARKLEGQEAIDTQQAAKANHPTAHLLGEVAGLIGPAGIEYGLARAGLLTPTIVGKTIRAIASKPVRVAARTVANAAAGAGYAAAQAAGHAEPGKRLQAAGQAAPIGAGVGAVLPFALGSLMAGKRLAGRLTGPIADFVAGEGPAAAAKAPAVSQHVAGGVLDDISQAIADRQAGRISEQDLNTALEAAGNQRAGTAPLPLSLTPSPKVPPDPLNVPTFRRRGLLSPDAVPAAKPGHPIFYGEGSPTRSPEVRGGEPLTPSANPEVAAALQNAPYDKLQAALRLPETPQVVKNLILIEIQRRGIVGPGLLAPR